MSEIVKILSNKKGLISGQAATVDDVKNAEEILGVKFAKDYVEYLQTYGCVCVDGHELTGICSAKRLNVVDITKEEMNENANIPLGAYVIEQAHIDGIVIWQTQDGSIYLAQDGKFRCICNSLSEYMKA